MDRNELKNLLAYSRIIEEQYQAAQDAEIWVAALALGCCLAESLLLMRAISSLGKITRRSKYASLTVEKLCSNKWGLSQLSKLALEMSWLDVKHMDPELVNVFINKISAKIPIPDGKRDSLEQMVPVFLLHVARNTRNTIHAGKIASEPHGIERQKFLEDADGNCAIVNLVLACLRETQNESAMGQSA